MLVSLDASGRVVAVNNSFLERTGHPAAQVLGRLFWDELLAVGSRVFFQTQLAPVLELEGQLHEIMLDLRTADGGRLPALMNATSHSLGGARAAQTVIALMSVPDRRAFEDRLRHARDAAEQARLLAERAHHDAEASRIETEQALADSAHVRLRLELLAQVNAALASSLDLDLALGRLTRVLAHRLADWCIAYVPDDDQAAALRRCATHTDPDRQADIELLAGLLPGELRTGSALHRVLRGAPATVLAEVSDERKRDSTDSVQVRQLYSTVGMESVLIVPASVRHHHVATIVLGRGERRTGFDDDDLADVTDVAARTGIVIDNLRRQAREHSNSVTLQHALLTTPPTSSRFEIATRYLPATNGNEVGGDWHDALLRPDGTPVVVIGDVVGHDIRAAAAMGQVRGILRTLAYTTAAGPADVLSRADATARGLGVAVLATAVIAQLDTDPDGGVTVTWSNAGHPPPVLLTGSGAEILTTEPERLLGLPADLDQPRHSHSRPLNAGDVLILYTDGLVERSDTPLEHNLATLAHQLAGASTADLDELCERILRGRTSDTDDDIALLVLRVATAETAPTDR